MSTAQGKNNEPFSAQYDPKAVEDRMYKLWEESGFFNPDKLPARGNGKPFCIVVPPPNVTGSLHLGHALNVTIQDILIRKKRMQGYKTLWLPGTDHAGIATQNVVEKDLKKQGLSRHDLGREKFVEKVWEWKEKYGGVILGQFRKLGASMDWSRTRFTMDAEYQRAVEEAFLHYHKKGWLYKAERVVNWCARCQTSLSDLELEYQEVRGTLYYIKYPIVGEKEKFITVATTRPETMLGDSAVAVNPNDARYKDVIGNNVLLPIQNREIPIVADDAVDKDFGTGAVKVTPAHDMLDAEIGERHHLSIYKVIGSLGKMTEDAGVLCAGLKIAECRIKIVEELKKEGLLEKEEPYAHNVAVCYRCATVIEPIPSMQWFLKMGELAKKALDAAESGKVRFHPERWKEIYCEWLRNVRDWNVSRQIWWGHRLPVWYKTNVGGTMEATYFKKDVLYVKLNVKNDAEFDEFSDKLLIDENENIGWFSHRKPTDEIQLDRRYINVLMDRGFLDKDWIQGAKIQRRNIESEIFVGVNPPQSIGWIQETDVLDTWFSSALWPFATLGWPASIKTTACKPEPTKDLEEFYPTAVLSTARDIINLWVSRMIFSGLEFMDKEPFRDVLVHPTILTKEGKRMSKSLGTGIDPMILVEKYGADATRFGLIWQAMGGQDVHWAEEHVIAGKKFCNKIWNSARFVLLQIPDSRFQIPNISQAATEKDKKILEQLESVKKEVSRLIDTYEFGQALHIFYEFFWHEFCDVYLETAKKQLHDEELKENTKEILSYVLYTSLKLLHPFLPFITEAIWSRAPLRDKQLLMVESWPMKG